MTPVEVSDEILAKIIAGNGVQEAVSAPDRGNREKKLSYFHIFASPRYANHNRRGWVTTGPKLNALTAVEYTEFMEHKGALPLRYPLSDKEEMLLHKPETRFVPLLLKGGITEFPVRQMAEYGWHLIPEVKAARPELGLIETFYCEYGCPTEGPSMRWFLSKSEVGVHYKGFHPEVAGPAAVGQQMAKAVQAASFGGMTPEGIAELVARVVLQVETARGVASQASQAPIPANIDEDGNLIKPID